MRKRIAEFRKVKNVLFLRGKTRAKEKFTEVQLQANQHLSLLCMNGILNVCKGIGGTKKLKTASAVM